MKIVVIGANGQLGTDCCNLLAGENETVACDIPKIDITKAVSVDTFLKAQQPDIIINCAAYTAVDDCEKELNLSWRVNCDGPKKLAVASSRLGCRLIHISTDYVFDGNRTIPDPYLETDIPNPLSQYGRSKLAGEEAVKAELSNNVILRTAWLYSGYGKNFLKTILRLALADPERELKVVNDQYGSLTWSRSLTLQIAEILKTDITGIVHATAEGYSTWYEAARYFLDTMKVPYMMAPCTTKQYPTPAHRPANSILENRVLKEAGISVMPDWKKEIDTFVKMYRQDLLLEARG